MLHDAFRALRQVPRSLALNPAKARISTAASCMEDPDENRTYKKPFRRPQQAHLVDTRRNLRERIGERPRSDGIMTPLGWQLFRCIRASTVLIFGIAHICCSCGVSSKFKSVLRLASNPKPTTGRRFSGVIPESHSCTCTGPPEKATMDGSIFEAPRNR